MYEVEAMVKQLIRESLEKRIEGRDHIDNIHDNNTLVTNWITDIMALGFNNCDVDAAAYDIYEVQLPLFGEQSIIKGVSLLNICLEGHNFIGKPIEREK